MNSLMAVNSNRASKENYTTRAKLTAQRNVRCFSYPSPFNSRSIEAKGISKKSYAWGKNKFRGDRNLESNNNKIQAKKQRNKIERYESTLNHPTHSPRTRISRLTFLMHHKLEEKRQKLDTRQVHVNQITNPIQILRGGGRGQADVIKI